LRKPSEDGKVNIPFRKERRYGGCKRKEKIGRSGDEEKGERRKDCAS
jgi:hypothetical protein